jgi:photosystem II stability/assembly factor-like uncharacterized protein
MRLTNGSETDSTRRRDGWATHRIIVSAAAVTAVAIATVAAAVLLRSTDSGGPTVRGGASGAAPMWQEIRLPERGTVTAFAVSPDGSRWYATTAVGVWWSADGEKWTRARAPSLTGPEIYMVSAAPGGVAFVTNTNITTIRTEDGGRSWSDVSMHAPDFGVVAAGKRGVVYGYEEDFGASEERYVVGRSADGGSTWASRGTLRVDQLETGLVVDPSSPNRLYAGGTGFFTSVDGGSRWKRTSTGLAAGARITAIAAGADGTLYAGTDAHGVFRSADSGTTWTAAGRGLAVARGTYPRVGQVVIGHDSARAYAVTEGRVATTGDGGKHWRRVTSLGERVNVVVAHPTRAGTILAAPAGRGILMSTDFGRHWKPVNAGLAAVQPTAIAADAGAPRTLYIGTATGLYRTRDGGETWSLAQGIDGPVDAIATHPRAPRTVYAGSTANGIARSLDRGVTWTRVERTLGVPGGRNFSIAIDPSRPGVVYVAAGWTVWKTADGGTSWRRTGPPLGRDDAIFGLAVDAHRPSSVYMSAGYRPHLDGRTFVSRDAGATWRATTDFYSDFAPVARTGGLLADDKIDGRFYYRQPDTDRWVPVRGGYLYGPWVADPRSGTVYAYAYGTGLFEAVPVANTLRWRRVGPPLEGDAARAEVGGLAFAGDGSRLYAYTGDGRLFALPQS